MGDAPVLSLFFFFFCAEESMPDPTGVFEHFREGEINIFLGISFRPHP
jgi:hypothetical protein